MCFHILLNTVIKDFRNREVRETSSREGVTVSNWGIEISKVKKRSYFDLPYNFSHFMRMSKFPSLNGVTAVILVTFWDNVS